MSSSNNHRTKKPGRASPLDRRSLIGQAGAMGILATIGISTTASGQDGTTVATPGSRRAVEIETLKKRVQGTVLVPGDEAYDTERAGWNRIAGHRPDMILMAMSAEDVASGVGMAAAAGLPIAVQATGHGPAIQADCGLLINTRQMTSCVVDPDTSTATFQPGITWEPILDAAAAHGLGPLVGTCSTVGATGYLTGGGLPALARTYGFAADHVRGIEIVTADAMVRHASPEEEPDLFWAVRGGKGNFGIVTSVETSLVPLSRLYGGGLFFPGESATDVLRAWLEWTSSVPEEMGSSVALTRFPDVPAVPEPVRGKFLVHVRISFTGSASEGERLLQPLRALGPIMDSVAEMPYTKVGEIFMNPTQPAPVRDGGVLLGTLDNDAIDTIVELAGPEVSLPPGSVEVRHLGGAIQRTPDIASPIGHRDASFSLMAGMIVPPGQLETVDAAQLRLFDGMRKWSIGRIFPNSLGSRDIDPEQVKRAYTDSDYERLRTIKKAYDPGNLFRFNHNIPPAT